MRDAFFGKLFEIASKDHNVIFLTADMGALSLEKFKKNLSSQYLNVGVAEQNMINIATGMALAGKNVFTYAIVPFATLRCYEQIKVGLSLMNLPVTIIGSGPGYTYSSDGPTHHSPQDIAIMRALPKMTILSPSDSINAAAFAQISYENSGPTYIRLDKGIHSSLYDEPNVDFSAGIAEIKKGCDLTIITSGIMVHKALKVVDELAKYSIEAGLVDLYRIKPINKDLLLKIVDHSEKIVTLEEHSIIGGVGSIISETLADNRRYVPLKRIALPDVNCYKYTDRETMHSFYGLDVKSITKTILNWNQALSDLTTTNSEYSPKKISSGNQKKPELAQQDFAYLFGTTIQDIPNECQALIKKFDFRYENINSSEYDRIIQNVIETITSDSLSVVGPQRKAEWEKGWSENLQNFVASNFNLDELIPKFIKRNEFIRINGNYVLPTNPYFETCFVEVLRTYLFKKYFSEVSTVYEFGCGTGLNLVSLAKIFPEKMLFGLDWSAVSCDIVNKIAMTQNLNLKGILFDMYSPDYHLDIDEDSAIFTIGAMEQLGKNFEPFLQFLLEKKPSICINLETIYELYDQSSLFDYVAAKYLEKRRYLQDYLPRLKQLEVDGRIEIIKIQKTFGSFYHDGYSFIVWKPRT